MIKLGFTAAYDPYHTIFRMICALRNKEDHAIHFERLRFTDFYLCFPWLLADVSAVRSIPGFLKKKNSVVRSYAKSRYDVLPNARQLFLKMEPIQRAALSGMISENVVEYRQDDVVTLSRKSFEGDLEKEIRHFEENNGALLDFTSNLLSQVEFYGPQGLKQRTGLSEYRYDDV